MKYRLIGLLVGGLVLAAAAPSFAATVTVQVEGATKQLAPTIVQTPGDFAKDGTHSCGGTSAAGALQAATAGDWSGSWFSFGSTSDYSVEAVLGESHTFGSGSYWSVYINNSYVNTGFCTSTVNDGDEVLAFASDDPFTGGIGGYEDPVVLTAPATAQPGQPFPVTVTEATTTFDGSGAGTTTFAPAAAATITAAGGATATTGADGRAELTLTQRGPVALTATKGNRVPDRGSTCISDGADGQCGNVQPVSALSTCVTSGDDGRCGTPDRRAAHGSIGAIHEQQHFGRGKGPRELRGRVDQDPSGIDHVLVRLTGRDGPRCSTYDAKREALVKLRHCGATKGKWFSVDATATSWRLLLPARLGTGRWVLDVVAVDKAGNRNDALSRGRNRVVFFVG